MRTPFTCPSPSGEEFRYHCRVHGYLPASEFYPSSLKNCRHQCKQCVYGSNQQNLRHRQLDPHYAMWLRLREEEGCKEVELKDIPGILARFDHRSVLSGSQEDLVVTRWDPRLPFDLETNCVVLTSKEALGLPPEELYPPAFGLGEPRPPSEVYVREAAAGHAVLERLNQFVGQYGGLPLVWAKGLENVV